MLKEIRKTETKQLRAYLDSRSEEINSDVLLKVNEIIHEVKENGDLALQKYTRQFDGVDLTSFRVSQADIEKAASSCRPEFVKAMEKAARNICDFHEKQKMNSYLFEKEDGVYMGERVIPLAVVGIYVPGGRAQYPSSVLMNALPAKIAGVERIVMVTPPSKDGFLLSEIALAAKLAGVDEIYTVGGAQAIAALACGTESIPRVDKITGPGNIYVAAAKKLVYGICDIDMIAGPSEILVIADGGANPAYVAADLLSQAEHDPMASAIFLTVDRNLLKAVNEELDKQLAVLPKREIAAASIRDYGTAIVCDTLDECIDFANMIAPEHLELMIREPMAKLNRVRNAGSVFLGYDTCESVGDYFGGTNHVLPTGGTARFSSALGVDAFLKRSCYLHYSEQALQKDGENIIVLAEQEDLEGHAEAVRVRIR